MNSRSRIGALALMTASLALVGCGDSNEKRLDFATYAEFATSPVASNGMLPPDLVPRSASNIHVRYNIDSTESLAEFDFAAAEEAMIEAPFLTLEQYEHRRAIEEGKATRPASDASSTYVRCARPPRPVEYLVIAYHGHARYWTSVDPKMRAKSCPAAAK